MTTLLQIKPYIHDFVEENLDNSFANKVYWLGERKNVPEYPYCLLNVIAENKDKRTSHGEGNITVINDDYFFLNKSSLNQEKLFIFPESENPLGRQSITTRYKTCTITVGIYNAWVEDTYDTDDMDIAEEFAYTQIDNLECAFEDYPINNMFSILGISSIRSLPEVVDGGYMYRYEFDLTIGYNEETIKDLNIGEEIDSNFNNKDEKIHFKVKLHNNIVTVEDLL